LIGLNFSFLSFAGGDFERLSGDFDLLVARRPPLSSDLLRGGPPPLPRLWLLEDTDLDLCFYEIFYELEYFSLLRPLDLNLRSLGDKLLDSERFLKPPPRLPSLDLGDLEFL